MQASDIVRNLAAHLNEDDEVPMATFAAAIPFFLVRLTTICVEKGELSVLREFILRSIQTGWDSAESISGFLGVRVEDVKLEINELVEELFVSTVPLLGTISLMEKGLRAISVNGLTSTTIREAACYVNGVTRQLDLTPDEMLPRRKLPPDTLVLPSIPGRPPRSEELDINRVKSSMMSNKLALPRLVEVARIGRVVRTNNLYVTGQLHLRRGAHTMPMICVKGAIDSDLALHVGAHPALQQVKAAVGRHEQSVKRSLYQRRPGMRDVSFLPVKGVLGALTSFVFLSDALSTDKINARQEFIKSSSKLVAASHWVGVAEAQTLFMRAVTVAQTKLLIVLPPESKTIIDLTALEEVQAAIGRGVAVEMHVSLDDPRFSKESGLRRKLKGVQLVPLLNGDSWCGFCCDQSFAVVGAVKVISSMMGKCENFFGGMITGDLAAEKLLRELAAPAQVSIKIRKKRMFASTPPR